MWLQDVDVVKTKQTGSLVKIGSPIHCIISQVLFCIEQNCLDKLYKPFGTKLILWYGNMHEFVLKEERWAQ